MAYMNIIRHGEKCPDSGDDLTKVGYARADYLGRCMSSDSLSDAMPFGKATAVMAGEGKNSLRPKETVTPLANKLNLTLHMPCTKGEAACFAENALQYLSDRGTLVVAWAHESIPPLITALQIPDVPKEYQDWPQACPSETFEEPSCSCEDSDSCCYDLIWQIKFARTNANGLWKPQSITSLHEGFGGQSSSPCAEDLAPKSEARVV
eukprot:CAMPEP_0169279206 /NCGR_PEP_ID=MMETSP1016-20121227/54825_1 /TAXON_ID=342587 /ORGANISM="Karlodinium micrum, Strain CCMP2283" /LENGTH=206 /DNA_ID=CAMNT_0009367199 /DNA_START=1 /DNA_END=621 /DNA_ORIENTATION=-